MEITFKPNINFILTQPARDFLNKHNSTNIYIEAVEINQCCIPLAAPPEVHRGIPRKPERYHLFETEGLTIYYDRRLPSRPKITLDVQGVGFLKGLKIIDWKISYL